jgi:hypothetical protein
MVHRFIALLVLLGLALLAPLTTRFYYPTFYRLIFHLSNFLAKHGPDLIRINAISGTELTQLNTLQADLTTILGNANFPKYRELP